MSRTVNDLVAEQLEDMSDGEEIEEYLSEGEGEPIESIERLVELDETFPTAIFISNVPKVNAAKFDKLLSVLGKLVDKFGGNKKHMPMDDAGAMTQGFVIVDFETPQQATEAMALDGVALDKSHTFKVVKLDQYEQIVNRDDTFKAKKTLNTFSRADFREWLQDENCREQMLLRYQEHTEIYWHDVMAGEPVLVYGGEREKAQKKIWCDWRVQWSPQGSYLATFHKQGIALWGGPRFEKKMRFEAPEVKYLDFSPTEDYMVTWNAKEAVEGDNAAVRMFRVLTGECVRRCRAPTVAPLGGIFPHYLWSPDGKYFAECNDSSISVRDTETFELIKDEDGKKKTLRYEGLATFQWSPKDNVLALWTKEMNNNPARAVLVEIPSRRELDSRSRTQVEATMHWQSEGDYLSLVTTKISKTGKRGATNLELFRLRQKQISVEVVEVREKKGKDVVDVVVRGFFWENRGNKFAVLTADESGTRPKLLIYTDATDKYEPVCSFDLPSNAFNNFFWAPDGQYFVCASTGSMAGGDLLFGGVVNGKMEILHKAEHFMLTDVMWDPSSRYVITAVTQPIEDSSKNFKTSMEAGYKLWTFQGRLLHECQKEKLWSIAWRPHPPCLLTKERQEYIRKNIKQFSRRYDASDDQAKEAIRKQFTAQRKEKMDSFQEVLNRLGDWKEQKEEEDESWMEGFGEYQGDAEWTEDVKILEEEVSKTEDLIS